MLALYNPSDERVRLIVAGKGSIGTEIEADTIKLATGRLIAWVRSRAGFQSLQISSVIIP